MISGGVAKNKGMKEMQETLSIENKSCSASRRKAGHGWDETKTGGKEEERPPQTEGWP